MKQQLWLIATAGVLATAPAAAQNNETAAPPANATNETVTTDTNVVATNMTVEAEPALPPTASDLASEAAADRDEDRGGFPWGVIGLVGLIGLLGRRRAN
jgi:hypothetical protein